MKTIIFTILILFSQLYHCNGKEIFNRMQPGGQYAYFNCEFDPVFAVVGGYARNFEIKAINRSLTLTGDITLPIFLLDLKHYRIEIGTRIAFFNWKKWNVLNRFGIINKGTDNPVYSGNLLSTEEGFLFGYFSNKWFVAGEFDYEKFLLTHIKHTNWYKDDVHADAKDGWYSSTGGKFTFGLQGGYLIKGKFEITLRSGVYMTEGFNLPPGAPFFANIGLNYHL